MIDSVWNMFYGFGGMEFNGNKIELNGIPLDSVRLNDLVHTCGFLAPV